MAPTGLRALARVLQRQRPWWWRAFTRLVPAARRWGWWVAPGNQVRWQAAAHGVEVTVQGTGHRLVVEPGAVLRNVVFDLAGEGHTVHIAAGCVLNQVYVRLRGQGHRLQLARGVRFTRGGEIWMEDQGGSLLIGEGTTIVHARLSVIEGTRLRIGAGSLFAYDIEVRTGDSHSLLDARTGQRLNPAADVEVGARVWVGARAMLLKGARIPDDSVVAAAAVVTKAFAEPGVVLGGHPARVLRRGVRWVPQRVPVGEPASDAATEGA